jgi:hypothetical protein
LHQPTAKRKWVIKEKQMTTIFEREEQAEIAYRTAKQAYHTAFNNGVDIGYDAVHAAKSILCAIRDQIHARDYEGQRMAKYDAIERNSLMLDDA